MTKKNQLLAHLFRVVRLASEYMSTGYRKQYSREPTFEKSMKRIDAEKTQVKATNEQIIERIEETVRACTKCRLSISRKKAVPGEGALHPRVMIIGEAPGEEEDLQGRPFVGPAGQYLSKWIEAIQLVRSTDCFITNTIKCRPQQNRQPTEDECGACFPYLAEQIDALKPVTILCVGLVSSKMLTRRVNTSMATLRERVYEYQGIPLVVTYHPSAVLRDQTLRKAVWDDLKKLQAILEQFP